MKKTILTLLLAAVSAGAIAADSDKAGRCIAVAYAMQRPKAAEDAYGLADNQRVAMKSAELAMATLKRTKGTTDQELYASQYINDCYKVGVKIGKY